MAPVAIDDPRFEGGRPSAPSRIRSPLWCGATSCERWASTRRASPTIRWIGVGAATSTLSLRPASGRTRTRFSRTSTDHPRPPGARTPWSATSAVRSSSSLDTACSTPSPAIRAELAILGQPRGCALASGAPGALPLSGGSGPRDHRLRTPAFRRGCPVNPRVGDCVRAALFSSVRRPTSVWLGLGLIFQTAGWTSSIALSVTV